MRAEMRAELRANVSIFHWTVVFMLVDNPTIYQDRLCRLIS